MRQVDRAQLFAILREAMQHRAGVPVSLGATRTSHHQKVGAFVYASWLEVGHENLSEYLDSFLSFTTDMCTELCIAEFSFSGHASLLPSWVRQGAMELDVEAGAAAAPLDGALLRHAIPIAGCLHIFSNAACQVNKALAWWKEFHSSMKVLETLLCNPMKLQTFVSSCMIGTPFMADHIVALFRKKYQGIYDKRWGEVYRFCVHVYCLLKTQAVIFDND